MTKKNKSQINIINVVSDALIVFLSYIIATLVRYRLFHGIVAVDFLSGKMLAIVAAMAFVVSVFYLVYKRSYLTIAIANAIGTLALMALFFVARVTEFSRLSLVLFWALSTGLVILKHVLGHRLMKSYYGNHNILIVGSRKAAEQFAADTGRQVSGYVSPDNDGLFDGEENGISRLGGLEDLPEVIKEKNIEEVVISLQPEHTDCVREVLAVADREGLYVSLVPFFSEYIPVHPEMESFGQTKLINLRSTPLDNFGLALLKRIGDIIGALLAIILSSPLMLMSVIGVKLSSPGPVFFKQERVGKDKVNFNMLKFRSMRVNASEKTGWSTDSDPRRTKFGSFIRKYSIDELPQFFNVLKGDMSLVGPRPEVPYYVYKFRETVPLYLVRQQVRPGITGWAQVNGLRGDTSIEERVEYDIWYIENWSLWLDIKILFDTVFGGKFKNNEK